MVPILLFFVGVKTRNNPFKSLANLRLPSFIGALCLVGAYLGGIYAYQTTTIANAAFLFAAAPFFTAVFAWPILKEPVRNGTWWAILFALIGVIIMVREGLALGALSGNISALGSAIGFAGFTIALRWNKETDVLPMVILGGILAIFITGLILVFSGTGFSINTNDILLTVVVAASILGCGMVCYTIGSRVVTATDLALLAMVEVALAPLWGFILINEPLGINNLIGGLLIIGSLVFNALTGIRHKPIKVS
jgi:drug/metabolite transporter (DMT)-like permease